MTNRKDHKIAKSWEAITKRRRSAVHNNYNYIATKTICRVCSMGESVCFIVCPVPRISSFLVQYTMLSVCNGTQIELSMFSQQYLTAQTQPCTGLFPWIDFNGFGSFIVFLFWLNHTVPGKWKSSVTCWISVLQIIQWFAPNRLLRFRTDVAHPELLIRWNLAL